MKLFTEFDNQNFANVEPVAYAGGQEAEWKKQFGK